MRCYCDSEGYNLSLPSLPPSLPPSLSRHVDPCQQTSLGIYHMIARHTSLISVDSTQNRSSCTVFYDRLVLGGRTK